MKKIFILIIAITFFSCNQSTNNYTSISGKIINKNSDSIIIGNRSYIKTISVNKDGSFKDTLNPETGVYSLYDGIKAIPVYLKEGFDLQITYDTKSTGDSIKFDGHGSVENNFLIKNAMIQQNLLDIEKLSQLNLPAFENELAAIEKKLNTFYEAHNQVDTFLINKLKNNVKPMLNSYKNYLAQGIRLRTELPKGTSSPNFINYENYHGGKTSLSDLKGKYVYIDIWATWCAPCKAEIPALKILEKKYEDKNIAFVSLSVDDGRGYRSENKNNALSLAKSGWKKMITEKKLGGIQLIAPKGWKSQFIQDYKITGIPRFILIDPKGNIVNPDAPRPSSQEINKLFSELSI